MNASPAALSRLADARTGVPYVRTTVRVTGERQVRAFEAMAHLAGRRPHELAADLVLQAIRSAQCDHEIQHAITELSAELDHAHDGPACRLCGCTENAACIGGCWWVPDPLLLGDLCSACLPTAQRATGPELEALGLEVSEVDAIAALLAYLPDADAAELVLLARTCPAPQLATRAAKAVRALEEVRAELTAVVATAHGQAVAAEDWLASLEDDPDPGSATGTDADAGDRTDVPDGDVAELGAA